MERELKTYPPEIIKSKRRLGLRCEAMVVLGFIWILMGLGVFFGASHPPDGMFFLMLPPPTRAAIWTLTGTAAVIAGLRSQQTSVALTSLIVMPMIRFTSYVWSWVLYLVPGHVVGEYRDGWYQAGFYLSMIALVIFVQHIPPGVLRVGFKNRDVERDPCPGTDDLDRE